MVEHQGNSILRKESRVSDAMVTIIHKVIITKIKRVITVTKGVTPKMHVAAREKIRVFT